MNRRALALLLLTGLAACGSPKDEEARNAARNEGGTVQPEPYRNAAEENAAAPTAPPASTDADSERFDHLGAITIGDSLAGLRKAGVKVAQDGQPEEGSTCGYARVAGLPDVFLMLDGDKVVRIDVTNKDQPTLGGVRVGQSEVEARERLGSKARVEPHPYTGPTGHYLVVHEKGAPRGLIVETDGKTVQGYRFGRWEQVQWIEGCS